MGRTFEVRDGRDSRLMRVPADGRDEEAGAPRSLEVCIEAEALRSMFLRWHHRLPTGDPKREIRKNGHFLHPPPSVNLAGLVKGGLLIRHLLNLRIRDGA